MRKTRNLMLLLVLVLAALSTFTAVPVSRADVPYDYCWQFSNQNCVYYFYNNETGCCEGIRNRPGPVVCPDICE
jgi:hypothetical protein